MSQFAGVVGSGAASLALSPIRSILEAVARDGTTALQLDDASFLHAHLDTGDCRNTRP
jgi:hypothetical protein